MASTYGPGESVTLQVVTQSAPGWTPTDADSLPTAVVVRNGTDTAETIVVAKVAGETGLYTCTFTIPSAWTVGDTVEVRLTATVQSILGTAIVWSERLGNDFIQGPVVGAAIGADIGSAPIRLLTFQKAEKTFALELKDTSGNPIDASGFTLRFVVESTADPSVVQITVNSGITVTGTGNNIVNVPVTETETATIGDGEYRWRLWDDSVKQVLLHGPFIVLATSES